MAIKIITIVRYRLIIFTTSIATIFRLGLGHFSSFASRVKTIEKESFFYFQPNYRKLDSIWNTVRKIFVYVTYFEQQYQFTVGIFLCNPQQKFLWTNRSGEKKPRVCSQWKGLMSEDSDDLFSLGLTFQVSNWELIRKYFCFDTRRQRYPMALWKFCAFCERWSFFKRIINE